MEGNRCHKIFLQVDGRSQSKDSSLPREQLGIYLTLSSEVLLYSPEPGNWVVLLPNSFMLGCFLVGVLQDNLQPLWQRVPPHSSCAEDQVEEPPSHSAKV